MSQEQSRNLVRETFESDFDRVNFAAFIDRLLKTCNFEKPFQQSGSNIRKAFQDKVSSFERIGQFTDQNAKVIDILTVNLKKETTLERGRTSLRNFAADYLQSERGIGKSAVLVAYVSDNKQDWRFSFVTLEKERELNEKGNYVLTVKKLTPARRYSFLVGKNENSHTAQKQFVDLLNSQSSPTLEQIEDAFKIEKVTKEFFERYKELFETTRAELKALITQVEKIRIEFEKKNINPDDFAKKLLGQIVFLYFLQKKGWFGVPREKTWGEGDKKFLKNLFENKQANKNFFNDYLEPLFYEVLAKPRDFDYYEKFDCKIPFLNGGLFEPLDNYDWVHIDIFLSDELFHNTEKTKEGDIGTGILDFFDRYNFTVNEAEPLETEVAVDPEMLGKVFENLLPENERHGKGTYYTPRVIVAYMCQQSLINYLSTNLPNIEKSDIEYFILHGSISAEYQANQTKEHKEKNLPASIVENAKEIDKLLADVKVCDPAIGSGAFPVGILQEIVKARETLISTGKVSNKTTYELKRHTIENSIYGVDLDSGAVEIAKLRLWLSLVVDEEDREQVEPLPNLDYKIMQGNSLLEEFRGISLVSDKLLEKPKETATEEIAGINAEINNLNKELSAIGIKEGKNSPKIEVIRRDLLSLYQRKDALTQETSNNQSGFDFEQKTVSNRLAELEKLHEDFKRETRTNEKKELRQRISLLEHEIISEHLAEIEDNLLKEVNKLETDLEKEIELLPTALAGQGEPPKIKKLRRELESKQKELANTQTAQAEIEMDFAKAKPFFLWKLQFSEIFREKDGFDIVIANPPFGADLSFEDKEIFKEKYENVHTRTPDTFNYFISQSLAILQEKYLGTLCFIVPNNLLFQNEYTKTRALLLKENVLITVINLGEDVFESAIVPSCVFILSNSKQTDYDFNFADLRQFRQRLKEIDFNSLAKPFSQADILETPSYVFGVNKVVVSILKQVEKNSVKIDKIVDEAAMGISSGGDKIFRISANFANENGFEKDILKKVLKGREIYKYQIEDTNHLIIYTHKQVEIESYPNIYKYLKNFKSQLIGKRETRQGKLPWWCLHWHRYPNLFESEKILLRQTSDKLIATKDTDNFYTLDSLIVLKLKSDCGYKLNFVLALLNSKLCDFIYQQITQEEGRVFAQVKSQNIRKLYIPNATDEQQNLIGKIVEYILHLKPNIDETDAQGKLIISYLEQIIDALAYELYLGEEIHPAGKEFFAPLLHENLPNIEDITGDKTAEIKSIFERLFNREHLIRQNIYFLDTIESVRIIEGKI